MAKLENSRIIIFYYAIKITKINKWILIKSVTLIDF